MRYKSCDELSVNLQDAQSAYRRPLQVQVAESLIEHVSARYGKKNSVSFETLLDEALDCECLEGEDRHAYKMALGLFFNARAQVRIKEKREMTAVPFAPR